MQRRAPYIIFNLTALQNIIHYFIYIGKGKCGVKSLFSRILGMDVWGAYICIVRYFFPIRQIWLYCTVGERASERPFMQKRLKEFF